MEIRWQIEDGYVGHGSRSFEVDDEEIIKCGSADEAMELIEEYARQDFENRVTWCFSNFDEFRAEVEELFESKKKDGQE